MTMKKHAPLALTLTLLLTACGGGGGGGGGGGSGSGPNQNNSSQSSVAPKNQVGIAGKVTDGPVPHATVTIYVGTETFTTLADANGNYTVSITPTDSNLNAPIKIVAKGPGSDNKIELVSLLPSYTKLLAQAGSDVLLVSSENPATNVTQVTTAEFALIKNKNIAIATDTELASAKASLSQTEIVNLAGLIKVFADNPTQTLPQGVTTTLELVLNKSATENALSTVNSKVLEKAIIATLNDPLVVPANELVGGWIAKNPDKSLDLLTLINNTQFVFTHIQGPGVNDGCQTGTEFGTYNWDKKAGKITFHAILDNDGPCGTKNTFGDKISNTSVALNSNTLTIGTAPNTTSFNKITGSGALIGSWLHEQIDDGKIIKLTDDPTIFSLLSVISDSQMVESGLDGSVDVFDYTYDLASKTLSVNIDGTIYKNTTELIDPNHFKTVLANSDEGVEYWAKLPSLIHTLPINQDNFLTSQDNELNPFRVNFTIDKEGLIIGGDYDTHTLKGTSTACTVTPENAANCLGVSRTISTSSQYGPLTKEGSDGTTYNDADRVMVIIGPDSTGYTFSGQLIGKLWFGTWTKTVAGQSNLGSHGTFSTYVNISEASNNTTAIVSANANQSSNALLSPNGGEIWKLGAQASISWDIQKFAGSKVDIYLLQDDPTGLVNNTGANLHAVVNSKTWLKLANQTNNSGNFSFDPASVGGNGNAYMVLVISSTNNSQFDLSNNTFTITK